MEIGGFVNQKGEDFGFFLVEVDTTIEWATCDNLLKEPREINIGNVGEKVVKESRGGSLGVLSVITKGGKRGGSSWVVMGAGRGEASSSSRPEFGIEGTKD
jgi:hypothetical protein